MIKEVWEAIHFGRFRSQWRHPLDLNANEYSAQISKTLFYENRLEKTENGWDLVTEVGGLLGRYAFYLMLPVYALFVWGMINGSVGIVHFALFEAAFIGVFGFLNGLALHKLAQEPDFGVETLSHRQIRTH